MPEIVPRLRCPIPDATVDQSPASGGVGNRADDFDERRRNFEAQRLCPGMPISFIFENGALKRCASDRTSSSAQAASCGVCFRFRPQDHDTIECGQLSCKSIRIPDEEHAQCSVERPLDEPCARGHLIGILIASKMHAPKG